MVKQLKDGSYSVVNEKQMKEAIALMREKSALVGEIEEIVEEEYGLSTLRKDATALSAAVAAYLVSKGKGYEDDLSTFSYSAPKRWKWNADKLKKLLPKNVFMAVCNYTPDPDKIDEAVKEGKINRKDIEVAYEAEPSKPYIRHYPKSQDKAAREDEAARVAAELGG